jgi:cystathionine gamma-lyase
MHRDTRILQAGYAPVGHPGPLVGGPQFSATYTTPGSPSDHQLLYGRFQNPTWTVWEAALAELEGGAAVAFASGMAAVAAVFGVCLKPRDIVVLPSDCYYTTRALASSWLASMGVEVRLAPTRGNQQAGALEGARLVWLETPSNPHLDICDIRLLVDAAHSEGALVAVDNTTATGYLQQPLALGADYVVASDTKGLTGHSDLVLGHVAAAAPQQIDAIRGWRTQHGAIPGPMETWLAHRSVATLALRLQQQCASALAVATLLASKPVVRAVLYPGLPDHPGHEIARRQMHAFGCVVSFDLGSHESADAFLTGSRLIRQATSFGGVHSTAERRARWGGDAVSEGFVRLSVGCEATEDLLEDIESALDRAARI